MADRLPALKTTHKIGEPVHAFFGAVDHKGRRFGARVRIDVIEWFAAEADVSYYRIPAEQFGVWFHAQPHTTRDGIDYGAWRPGKCFRTEAEALDYAAKYFIEAEKRALKNKARAA